MKMTKAKGKSDTRAKENAPKALVLSFVPSLKSLAVVVPLFAVAAIFA